MSGIASIKKKNLREDQLNVTIFNQKFSKPSKQKISNFKDNSLDNIRDKG